MQPNFKSQFEYEKPRYSTIEVRTILKDLTDNPPPLIARDRKIDIAALFYCATIYGNKLSDYNTQLYDLICGRIIYLNSYRTQVCIDVSNVLNNQEISQEKKLISLLNLTKKSPASLEEIHELCKLVSQWLTKDA